MAENRFRRAASAIADCWSFQMGTLEIWLFPTPETPEDRAIRLEGERIRKAFPWIDFDHPNGPLLPDMARRNENKIAAPDAGPRR
jgi:hypothetical protein